MPATRGLPIERAVALDATGERSDERRDRNERRARWMALAQQGDGQAYRALLDDLGPVIVRYLRRRLRDHEDLADAYQDTFLAAPTCTYPAARRSSRGSSRSPGVPWTDRGNRACEILTDTVLTHARARARIGAGSSVRSPSASRRNALKFKASPSSKPPPIGTTREP